MSNRFKAVGLFCWVIWGGFALPCRPVLQFSAKISTFFCCFQNVFNFPAANFLLAAGIFRFLQQFSVYFHVFHIELLIGQSSTEAERKRAARLQNKALSAPRTNDGHLSDIRPPEIEIELEKEIEIKREIEKGRSARAYGRYQNVFLTDEELADLQASFPTVWGQYIEKLSEYMASTGKRYQSHAATIRRWAGEDAKKAAPPTRNRDYSVKEDETV